jgi:hypothetical protein
MSAEFDFPYEGGKVVAEVIVSHRQPDGTWKSVAVSYRVYAPDGSPIGYATTPAQAKAIIDQWLQQKLLEAQMNHAP